MLTPKIALVHDWLTGFAGAEQVLLALHHIFPEAPIFTSIFNPAAVPQFADAEVIPSYLQKIPTATKRHQVLIPLMPQAFESFNLKGFDIIISSSTGPAKGIIVQPGQKHICYCHTPPRYLWKLGGDTRNEQRYDSWLREWAAHRMRIWDVVSSERVDQFVANSESTAARIRKIYRRDSMVIYPPVQTERFLEGNVPPKDYFLSVSRLIEYKRLDLIIKACIAARVPLKVSGTGPEEAALRKLAGEHKNIEFLGRVADSQLGRLYGESRALIFAAEEDFGIVPVEAMSAGRPVIAYGKGGATESVKEGVTGTLFNQQSVESLVEALRNFSDSTYNSEKIRAHARQFDSSVFKEKIQSLVLS